MFLRNVTRVVTFDPESRKILLVKNQGQNFWYPPGGGWEYEKENILQCAEREVSEETGLKVSVKRLLYVQEFRGRENEVNFESIWLALPVSNTTLDELHVDEDVDGKVEIAKWFSREELLSVTVYPERLQGSFWTDIDKFLDDEDPFIGVKN